MTFNEAIIKYTEHFGENFPAYFFMDASDAELVAMIEKALANNAPIVVENEQGFVY